MTKYIETAGTELIKVVSIDQDDRSMNNTGMIPWMQDNGIQYHIGPKGRTKIEAINADIPSEGWDVMVLASDDHLPVREGWALQVEQDASANPDSLLWYTDIRQDRITLMPVMDRTYYQRFGYIYHPAYKSLFCDNEQTEVAQQLGRVKRIAVELWRNESADWGGFIKKDNLLKRNNAYYRRDQRTYERRKAQGFPL
jgi:hypothetical protein